MCFVQSTAFSGKEHRFFPKRFVARVTFQPVAQGVALTDVQFFATRQQVNARLLKLFAAFDFAQQFAWKNDGFARPVVSGHDTNTLWVT